MKTLLLAAALALAPAAASAQSASPAPAAPAPQAAPASQVPLPDANPALWVVRDDDTTIYLFGTFHLLDGRPWFNDEVRTAFDASSEVVLEAIIPENPAELQPLIIRYAVDPQGRSLSTRLTAEQNAELGRALQALGAPPAAFDRFEPWFVAMSMTAVAAQQMGISSDNGPEGVITRAARRPEHAGFGARGDRVAAAPVRRHARRACSSGSCANRSTNSTRSARRCSRCSPHGPRAMSSDCSG